MIQNDAQFAFIPWEWNDEIAGLSLCVGVFWNFFSLLKYLILWSLRRPNNFCYHCNENFATKDDLKYHVENIVKKQTSGGNNGYRNGNYNRNIIKIITLFCIWNSQLMISVTAGNLPVEIHREIVAQCAMYLVTFEEYTE